MKYRKNKEGSTVKIKKDPDAEETNSEEDEPPLPGLYLSNIRKIT